MPFSQINKFDYHNFWEIWYFVTEFMILCPFIASLVFWMYVMTPIWRWLFKKVNPVRNYMTVWDGGAGHIIKKILGSDIVINVCLEGNLELIPNTTTYSPFIKLYLCICITIDNLDQTSVSTLPLSNCIWWSSAIGLRLVDFFLKKMLWGPMESQIRHLWLRWPSPNVLARHVRYD